MPDLTIEIWDMCASVDGPAATCIGGYEQTGLFDERTYPECTCKAYQFGKRTEQFGGRLFPKRCKHIKQAEEEACGWHALYSDEHQTQEGVCPRCGGETIKVRVAV